jgi:hypothetical protein
MSNEKTTVTSEPAAAEPERPEELAGDTELTAIEAAYECFRAYAREQPGVMALWCLGLGFVLGWKLKPW